MRITSEVMVTRSLDRLHTRLKAYERSQSELATGRRILQPSDDPAGSRRAMALNGGLRAREQELKNISDATGWLEAADSQLQTVLGRLARVRELTVAGASDTNAASERVALAQEIRQITEELVGIANTRHLDRPLFGGFTSGDAATQVAGEWVFAGTGDEVRRRISDTEHVQVNTTAAVWLGSGSGEDNLLGLLEAIADELETGTAAGVGNRIGALTAAANRVGNTLATIGAATNRVESARERADSALLTLRRELSDVQDVDIAAGIMELQVQQVAYEATLQALAKALPPSLVAFLR